MYPAALPALPSARETLKFASGRLCNRASDKLLASSRSHSREVRCESSAGVHFEALSGVALIALKLIDQVLV
jgi:hypothetical protein